MKEIKKARRNLYILLEKGNRKGILEASQYLDKLILEQTINMTEQKNNTPGNTFM